MLFLERAPALPARHRLQGLPQRHGLALPPDSSYDAVVDNFPRTSAFIAGREARQEDLRSRLEATFASQAAITLEVGSGHGHFLTAFAAHHPERFCVGIDIARDRVARAGRKRERACLPNLRFLHAEAQEFIAALPNAVCLQDIFILFPDPWPKRRHHKNRLFQKSFLSSLAERAEQGARLFFRTDYGPYFAEARKVIDAHSDWVLEADSKWTFELETVFQSRASAYESLVAQRK